MCSSDLSSAPAAAPTGRRPGHWNTVPFSALIRTPWIRYRAEHVVPLADLIAAEDQAAIVHYVSPSKPWKGLLPHGAARDLFQQHADAVWAAEHTPGSQILAQRKDLAS